MAVKRSQRWLTVRNHSWLKGIARVHKKYLNWVELLPSPKKIWEIFDRVHWREYLGSSALAFDFRWVFEAKVNEDYLLRDLIDLLLKLDADEVI